MSVTYFYFFECLFATNPQLQAAKMVLIRLYPSVLGVLFSNVPKVAFAMALPANPTTDFIGQISAPMPNNNGWAGVSLAGDMEGPLLITAWPNTAQNPPGVMSSFRIASNEDDSPPEANGSFTIQAIDNGTVCNGTHMTFTFLCQNCIDAKLGFAASDTSSTAFEMGWALGDKKVSDPADSAATLAFHNVGE